MVVLLATIAIFILTIVVILIRFKPKMAQFICWIFESVASGIVTTITGAREATPASVSENKTNTTTSKNKKPEAKSRQRPKKSNEEPSFSTHLTTPIESIIEETINDVLKTAVNKESKSSTKFKTSNKESKPSSSGTGTIKKIKQEPAKSTVTSEKLSKKSEPAKKEVKATTVKPPDTKIQEKQTGRSLEQQSSVKSTKSTVITEKLSKKSEPAKKEVKATTVKPPDTKTQEKQLGRSLEQQSSVKSAKSTVTTEKLSKKSEPAKKEVKTTTVKPPDTKTQEKQPDRSLEQQSSVDEFGFSFFPVKEKLKPNPKAPLEKKDSKEFVNEIIAQGIRKRADHSKPSIIVHFNKPAVPKKVSSVEKSQDFVIVNGVYGEKHFDIKQAELKESKRVSATISYASVVTNDFTDSQFTEQESKQAHQQDFENPKKTQTKSQFDVQQLVNSQRSNSLVNELKEESSANLGHIENQSASQESPQDEITAEDLSESDSSRKENTHFTSDHTASQLFHQESTLTVDNLEKREHSYKESEFHTSQTNKSFERKLKENPDIRITYTESEFVDQNSKQADDLNVQFLIKKFESGELYTSKRKRKDSSSIEVISENTSETQNTDYQNLDLKDISNTSESFVKVEFPSADVSFAEEAIEFSKRVSLNGTNKELNGKELLEKNRKEITDSAEETAFQVVTSAAKETGAEEIFLNEDTTEKVHLVDKFENNSTVDVKNLTSTDFAFIEEKCRSEELENRVVLEDSSKEIETLIGPISSVVNEENIIFEEENININFLPKQAEDNILFEDRKQSLIFESRYFVDLNHKFKNNSTVDENHISTDPTFIEEKSRSEELENKVVFEDSSRETETLIDPTSSVVNEENIIFKEETINNTFLSKQAEDNIVFENRESSLIFESRYFADTAVQNSSDIEDTAIVDSLKDFIGQERENISNTQVFKEEPDQSVEKDSALDTEKHIKLSTEIAEDPSAKLLQEETHSCSLEKLPVKVTQEENKKDIPWQAAENFEAINTSLTERLESVESEESELVEDLKSVVKKDLSSETASQTQNLYISPYLKMLQIRVLTLNDKEHQESTIYRIEKNWIIQFRLGPSLLGRKVNLYCNYPGENDGKLEEFDRCKYQLLSWSQDEGCKNADDTALYTQIEARLAGSFHYYFSYENGENAERQGSGFFLVDPVLKYGDNEDLPLDCIQCQTVLAKGLGPFSTWEKKLQVAKESGYNMIHFTPVQELGASNSSYSLSEQLKLNPVFNEEDNGKKPSFSDVEKLVGKLRKEWKISSICDIVLNHTANESEWLKTHPEVTYNCKNCPYLRPAYLLDAAFHQFSMDVKKGLYEDRGIPAEVCNEDHLNAIRYHFKLSVLEPLKIHEMFTVNTENLVSDFMDLARKTAPAAKNNHPVTLEELRIIQDPEFRRLKSKIDMDLAIKTYNTYRSDSFDEDTRLRKCAEDLKHKLDDLNKKVIDTINADLHAALENVVAGIRYFRVQADGPKFTEITIDRPLVYRYFTDVGTPQDIEVHEEIMYGEKGAFLMAHNGWVMHSDPLKNFADSNSKVYFRRELIAWGDSVKLRYGESPADCPFLWEHMRKYVELTAKIFDGVRLDNCHSTPLNVAEYLLDCARRVRPDLYVVAELFTNSDLTDNIFVNRLGITSLIREAMSAWDSHEEGRLVYRYGGVPVGSFYQPNIRPLVPTVAHALFLDLTHDNPSPVEKRSVFDLLPSTALVNMACCASGSNRGYDELVPHHIHVVDETRQYTEWTDDENLAKGNPRYVTKHFGIIAAKKAINDLHFKLGKEGFNQVYVDQMDPDIVAVTRHNPETHQSYVLVAYTAFTHPNEDSDRHQKFVKPLRVEGVLDEIVFEASLSYINAESGSSKFTKFKNFIQDSKWINGLSEYQVTVKEHIQVEKSDIFEKVNSGSANLTQLNFKNFKPGSVVVVKVSLPEDMKDSVNKVRKLITEEFSFSKATELKQIVEKLKLSDLNRALYRCDQEERDEGFGFDVYNIPNFGSLVYAGLQGFMSLLAKIRPSNDLGHPMCGNLRDGNWMLEYIWKRLKLDEGTKELGQWIEENTKCFNTIPRYLVPCYFDVVITGIYITLLEQCYKLMSGFVSHGSTFVKALSLGSVQFGAYIKSADLPTLSPNLAPPKPPTRKNKNGEVVQACVTLSAGLPHFSVGYMRNWGRDTFIALRGLFILTGRYQEAREHILGYAACLRHGLIPNLLDGGRNSRFNCRDAVWWWLYCIKEYVQEAPNGVDILNDKVSRLFPKDDSPPQPPGTAEQTLAQVIQEALNVHFQGLAFRERNAGRQIDEHMTDKGFNNQIGVHPDTGFVFGGNEWNCGTWMDKMGSSDKAGNRGKPATPRDGSAIELIGLSKSVITWLHRLHQSDKYPYNGVERTHKNGAVTRWTFKEWSDKIQENFEKYFWVNTEPTQGEVRPDLINQRGIYKDSFGATHAWCDFQLRCNFPIAMVAAPELFNPQHAWTALQNAEKRLLGPLGMKTLDPSDWNYRGDYDNSNDSSDPSVAHGFNYHQGPEWVWPVGFFLRAKLLFAQQNGALKETLADTKVILSKHFVELQTSLWRGLPELTNSDGAYCRDSSRTQAWSMSCILEVLHYLQQIESKQIVVN